VKCTGGRASRLRGRVVGLITTSELIDTSETGYSNLFVSQLALISSFADSISIHTRSGHNESGENGMVVLAATLYSLHRALRPVVSIGPFGQSCMCMSCSVYGPRNSCSGSSRKRSAADISLLDQVVRATMPHMAPNINFIAMHGQGVHFPTFLANCQPNNLIAPRPPLLSDNMIAQTAAYVMSQSVPKRLGNYGSCHDAPWRCNGIRRIRTNARHVR
jgi:hypothetical protein